MAPAPVQELVADEGRQGQFSRNQAQFIGADPVNIDGLYVGPDSRPAIPVRRRPDQVLIGQQIVVELPVHQQAGSLPEFLVIVLQLLELVELLHPVSVAVPQDQPFQVILIGGCLQCQQVRIQILLHRLIQLAIVTTLIKQENQNTHQHQPEGYPGRAFPVNRVLSGNNQHGESQFIIICP